MHEDEQPAVGGILPLVDGIWSGGARAAYSPPALRERGSTRVLKLYFDDPTWPADCTVCNSPPDDGQEVRAELLHRGTTFIREAGEAGVTVLVVCGLAISRSATFVLAYPIEQGYPLPDAWCLLRERHSIASPHPRLWPSLLKHYALPYSLPDVAKGW